MFYPSDRQRSYENKVQRSSDQNVSQYPTLFLLPSQRVASVVKKKKKKVLFVEQTRLFKELVIKSLPFSLFKYSPNPKAMLPSVFLD